MMSQYGGIRNFIMERWAAFFRCDAVIPIEQKLCEQDEAEAIRHYPKLMNRWRTGQARVAAGETGAKTAVLTSQ